MADGKKRARKRQRKSKTDDRPVEEITSTTNQAARTYPSETIEKHAGIESTSPASVQPSVSPSKKTVTPKTSSSFYDRTNPHKPSALLHLTSEHTSARKYTVSVALPGSIVLNAQTPELQSRLAGQLARTCAIFNIDEIVVFDEATEAEVGNDNGKHRGRGDREWNRNGSVSSGSKRKGDFDEGSQASASIEQEGGETSEGKKRFDPNGFLARILQYVETPQYLRKALFPMHRDLRLAGLLPPLDCPHHLRFEEESAYREGVVEDAPPWTSRPRPGQKNVFVNVGFRDHVICSVRAEVEVPLGARVTVKLPTSSPAKAEGKLVSPREPVEQLGTFWGYAVRLCPSLSDVLGQCQWGSYDLVIGTSERGASLTSILSHADDAGVRGSIPPFDHALIVLGGLSGLEVAVERDPKINLTADDADQLFDLWINVAEGQGSRTVRTEEALIITLARLKTALEEKGRR